MDQFRPQPRRRRPVSERAQRLISYAWIIASLALPAMGVAMLASGAASVTDTEAVTHEVRAGETLGAIATRYGVTVDQIVQANGLNNPNVIYAGQTLVIPRLERAASGEQQVYTIGRGDTLSAIATRYEVTIDELTRANGLANPNSITAGQTLIIPGEEEAPAEPEVVETAYTAPSREAATYTLQRGDSLYRVALVYGLTVDDLLSANNLASPNAIYPGLTLRVPVIEEEAIADSGEPARDEEAQSPRGGRTYTIRPGDTLSKIAIRHQVTVDGLVAANNLRGPDRIYVGQTLNIPESGTGARPYPAQAATVHTVQRGETLSQIAMRYGVTAHSLIAANDLENASSIYAGLNLSIPSGQAGSHSIAYASVGPGLCQNVDLSRSGTGYFIRPVRGYILTQRYHPLHAGIDLAINLGAPVFAADGGTVVFSGWNPVGYGNLVVLDHGNGWRTYYAHLEEVDVSCGDWVPRGSILGEIGSTGNSTGPHLHFELLRFGIAVNPAGYIRF